MRLYRGDSLPVDLGRSPSLSRGRTFANYFCSNGLMAKFADGGHSDVLRNKSLAELIASHVGYLNNTAEQAFSFRSPFISFTTDKELAFNYSDRHRRIEKLEPCTLDSATYFLWQFDVNLEEMSEVEPGRYVLPYRADPRNCVSIIREQIERGQRNVAEAEQLDIIADAVRSLATMYHAENDVAVHYAEVIDVIAFMANAYAEDLDRNGLVKNTLERAERDQEWLIYPKDPMPHGKGYSSRLAMNKHLSVAGCFRPKSSAIM